MHSPFLTSHDAMCHEVLHGLSRERKTISSKYFYDARGCTLFNEICELPEYYPTRAELGIMQDRVAEMAAAIGPGAVVVEYGSGSSTKTRLLLDALESPRAYVPLDIASDHLQETAAELEGQYPHLDVLPVQADFTREVNLPGEIPAGRRAVYFPGSTIGNLRPHAATELLRQTSRIAPDGGMLLGIDLVKDVKVLEAAYNDARGVTAAFNLNLLERFNRELDATFDLDQFRHHAFFNREHLRIEMHLVSLRDQDVEVAGEVISLRTDETIRTELSHKYDLDLFGEMAVQADLEVAATWTDAKKWFAVVWLVPTTARRASKPAEN